MRSAAEAISQFNHPTQFVKGALQMLSNRNEGSDESVHPTHRLEPQLLDGFVDIHNFANEYLRSQFGQELIGDLVPVVSFFFSYTCLLIPLSSAVADDNHEQFLRSLHAPHG